VTWRYCERDREAGYEYATTRSAFAPDMQYDGDDITVPPLQRYLCIDPFTMELI
jgi:hypothetical protein